MKSSGVVGLGLTRNDDPDHWGQTGLGKKIDELLTIS
jgi:hypothetical protein